MKASVGILHPPASPWGAGSVISHLGLVLGIGSRGWRDGLDLLEDRNQGSGAPTTP